METKGCMGKSKFEYVRGPPGAEVRFDICPVRFVSSDVLNLVQSYNLTGRKISMSEQKLLPPPLYQAILFTKAQHEYMVEQARRNQERSIKNKSNIIPGKARRGR